MTTALPKPFKRIAIAGAGCAGCSLACEILARIPDARVTIFDPRPTPDFRKTWCFWETRPHRFTEAISARWNRVTVCSRDTNALIDTMGHPYACIRSQDFHRVAERQLSNPNCELHRGTAMFSAVERPQGVDLTLKRPDGSQAEETFDILFDGRPADLPLTDDPREPLLLQHFGGVELTFAGPPLDPSIATLMDFDVPQNDGTHFMYVLPFAPNRVLVESTFITPDLTHRIDYEANALSYARTKLGIQSADILYRETGVLPMTLRPLGPPPSTRIWPIGTRAGIARPSSGYAFDAIQRDSSRLVDALIAGMRRPKPPRAALLGSLDRVLLSWLSSDASAAGRAFPQLFRGTLPQRLIRFLSDTPQALDYLAVMWAMPKAQIIGHVLTHARAWPRRQR